MTPISRLAEFPRPGLPEVILNRQSKPGEPATFEAHLDPKTGKKITFARVSLLENAARSGRVLLVAGQSMSATEMAGEFLLRDDSVPRVRQMLGLSASAPIPDLEMILKVSEQNEIGDSVDPVACRRVIRRTQEGSYGRPPTPKVARPRVSGLHSGLREEPCNVGIF
jgi:hypothetical protein